MIDNNLTALIESIEDKLQKYILDVICSICIKAGKVQKLIITPADKAYSADVTAEQVLNDPDNIVISVVPQQCKTLPGDVVVLPKEKQDEIINKMVLAYNTIQSIKNNIISLRYSDKETGQSIINDLLVDKYPMLCDLENTLTQSVIFNRVFKEKSDELISMIRKLNNEITTIPPTPKYNNPIEEKIIPPYLLNLRLNECQYLYNELIKNECFLPKDTNPNHFNYIFGGGVCPNDFAPLHWNKSKQAISELILLLLGKTSIPRKIQRDASGVFIIKKKAIGNLSNPKKGEYSNDYGALETIVQAINSRSS